MKQDLKIMCKGMRDIVLLGEKNDSQTVMGKAPVENTAKK